MRGSVPDLAELIQARRVDLPSTTIPWKLVDREGYEKATKGAPKEADLVPGAVRTRHERVPHDLHAFGSPIRYATIRKFVYL